MLFLLAVTQRPRPPSAVFTLGALTECLWRAERTPDRSAKEVSVQVYGYPLCDDFCEAAIEGCVEEDACNYNPDANVESDCTFPIEYYDCNNNCMNDIDGDVSVMSLR